MILPITNLMIRPSFSDDLNGPVLVLSTPRGQFTLCIEIPTGDEAPRLVLQRVVRTEGSTT